MVSDSCIQQKRTTCQAIGITQKSNTIIFLTVKEFTSLYNTKCKWSICSLEISAFKKVCFMSAKMAVLFEENCNRILKILDKRLGHEYKHSFNKSQLELQDA